MTGSGVIRKRSSQASDGTGDIAAAAAGGAGGSDGEQAESGQTQFEGQQGPSEAERIQQRLREEDERRERERQEAQNYQPPAKSTSAFGKLFGSFKKKSSSSSVKDEPAAAGPVYGNSDAAAGGSPTKENPYGKNPSKENLYGKTSAPPATSAGSSPSKEGAYGKTPAQQQKESPYGKTPAQLAAQAPPGTKENPYGKSVPKESPYAKTPAQLKAEEEASGVYGKPTGPARPIGDQSNGVYGSTPGSSSSGTSSVRPLSTASATGSAATLPTASDGSYGKIGAINPNNASTAVYEYSNVATGNGGSGSGSGSGTSNGDSGNVGGSSATPASPTPAPAPAAAAAAAAAKPPPKKGLFFALPKKQKFQFGIPGRQISTLRHFTRVVEKPKKGESAEQRVLLVICNDISFLCSPQLGEDGKPDDSGVYILFDKPVERDCIKADVAEGLLRIKFGKAAFSLKTSGPEETKYWVTVINACNGFVRTKDLKAPG